MGDLKDFQVKHVSDLSIKGDQALVVMDKEEWLRKGTELFGPDWMNWQFVCPACGHVAKIGDFKQYGAKPNAATCECIGRYDGHINVPMGEGRPCNYTGYGLLDLCPVRVMDGGEEIRSFAFAESSQEEKGNGMHAV